MMDMVIIIYEMVDKINKLQAYWNLSICVALNLYIIFENSFD